MSHDVKTNSHVIQEALALLEKQSLFNMFTEMGKSLDAEAEAVLQLAQEAAEDFLDESW